MKTIEQVLETPLEINGSIILAKDMPITSQIEYLIDEHFEIFSHPSSKLWRLQNCYYVMNKKMQKVLFVLNEAQKHFVDNYLLKGFLKLIILKSRQLGFTTLVALWFLDEIIFKPNTEALQIAHTLKDAGELFNKKVAYAIKTLPKPLADILDISTSRSNKVEFIFRGNNNEVLGTSSLSVSNSGRSGTYPLLHISELAKLSKLYPARADEIVTGTLPAVPMSNSLVIIESTAEGVSGLFYDKYMSAYKRRDIITPALTVAEFMPVFYNWTWDKEQIREACINGVIPVESMEEAEIDWADFKKEYNLSDEEISYYYTKWIQAERDVHKLHQEYPTTEMEAFISTGANFFSTKKIFKELEKLQIDEKEYKTYTYENGEFYLSDKKYSEKFEGLIVFDEPEKGRNYVVGGDVAEGLLNGDWSVGSVLGMDKLPKAIYRGHVDPDEFTSILQKIGSMYNNALMAVEFNKDGNWVNTELVNRGYPNMYFRTQVDDITKTISKKFGWTTGGGQGGTRNVALGEMRTFFSSCADFPYKIILDEMVTFVRDKRGKPQAQLGKHDDVIMATSIAYGVLQGQVETKKEVQKTSIVKSIWG